MNVEPLLVSADSPQTSHGFRDKLEIPFVLLADEDHRVADLYGVPISRRHPKAWSYRDGFIQPAIFAYGGEDELFTFVQWPGITNLWGAAGRPTPEQVLERVEAGLARPTRPANRTSAKGALDSK